MANILSSIVSGIKHSWNVFRNRDPTERWDNYGEAYAYRPDRPRMSYGAEKSIINTIVNRIAVDVAAIDFYHARLDEDGRFSDYIPSKLNNCLRLEANIDQSGRAFVQDIVMSMLDEGCVAVVPTCTSLDPKVTDSYDICEMRTAKVVEWYPKHVRVSLYNDETGRREEIVLPKTTVAIIENPFYSIMNEKNSTMQRLKHKLSLLDISDEKTTSGKLDLIVQLPYVLKSETQKKQAEDRRLAIETQLATSQYGVAYCDGTEKIVQLNRSVDNNLLAQIEYLTKQVHAQLGLTDEILNGTANEQTMLNYNKRVVEPIARAIVCEFNRRFLTKTARTQRQIIAYTWNPFSLVPVNNIAEIADKFTRNEIMTSNEIRSIIGLKPSKDPKADKLLNSNISQPDESQNNDGLGVDSSALQDVLNTRISDLT